MDYRIEKDTMGEVRVAKEKLWGAQTQRSIENFPIGQEKMPKEVIYALAIIKKAAAEINYQLGVLDDNQASLIVQACDDILKGNLDDHFPLSVWQTGSGTQTNMNINEVIANRGNELAGETILHPNDHVNKGQSSNDTFPSAMHIAVALKVKRELIPAIENLAATFGQLSKEYEEVVKIGRTHLQDAVPLTLGQEISAWETMLLRGKANITKALETISELALGGTAVGTGLNAEADFDKLTAKRISEYTKLNFHTAENKFHALTSQDSIVVLHGSLKALAADTLKIVNDVRWLSSGPRCGIGELIIPENEPGSSIMPGKINPTQCEAMAMIICQIFGNDVTVSMAASQGNFQLNVFMPVIIYNTLQSIYLLVDGLTSFNERCAKGIRANFEVIQKNLDNSLMLATALTPALGYDKAAQIAKYALEKKINLKEAALALGEMTEEEFEKAVNPIDMV